MRGRACASWARATTFRVEGKGRCAARLAHVVMMKTCLAFRVGATTRVSRKEQAARCPATVAARCSACRRRPRHLSLRSLKRQGTSKMKIWRQACHRTFSLRKAICAAMCALPRASRCQAICEKWKRDSRHVRSKVTVQRLAHVVCLAHVMRVLMVGRESERWKRIPVALKRERSWG